MFVLISIVTVTLLFFMLRYMLNQRCKAIYGPEYELFYDICLPRKDL